MAGSGGTANSTVNLTVPDSAASGTDVTLTIEVQNAAGTDMNYIVLRFSVAAKVTIVGCQTKCMILDYTLLYMLTLAYPSVLLNKLHLVRCVRIASTFTLSLGDGCYPSSVPGSQFITQLSIHFSSLCFLPVEAHRSPH